MKEGTNTHNLFRIFNLAEIKGCEIYYQWAAKTPHICVKMNKHKIFTKHTVHIIRTNTNKLNITNTLQYEHQQEIGRNHCELGEGGWVFFFDQNWTEFARKGEYFISHVITFHNSYTNIL